MIPYWYMVGACLLCLVVGWVGGVARRRERRIEQALPAADGLDGGVWTWPTSGAQWRGQATVVDFDEETQRVTPMQLPPRGFGLPDLTLTMPTVSQQDATTLAADFPAPAELDQHHGPAVDEGAMGAVLESVETLETELREPGERLDLATMFDVESDDDEPDDQPPAGGGGDAEPLCAESPLPRYRPPSPAEPWPAGRGVGPDGRMLHGEELAAPIKVRRLYSPARVLLARIRSYLRERWEAAKWDSSPGWAPGEVTELATAEQPTVAAEPVPVPPVRKPPAHLEDAPGRKWARVLLPEDWRPTGNGGRHHVEVAPGAIAQRQLRLLALPAGSR